MTSQETHKTVRIYMSKWKFLVFIMSIFLFAFLLGNMFNKFAIAKPDATVKKIFNSSAKISYTGITGKDGYRDTMKVLYENGLQAALDTNTQLTRERITEWDILALSVLKGYKEDYKSSKELAEYLVLTVEDPFLKGAAKYQIACVLNELGDYKNAYENCLESKALELEAKSYNDVLRAIVLQGVIALNDEQWIRVNESINDYVFSVKKYDLSEGQIPTFYVLSAWYRCYKNDYMGAVKFSELALNESTTLNHKQLANGYVSLSFFYFRLNDLINSKDNLTKANAELSNLATIVDSETEIKVEFMKNLLDGEIKKEKLDYFNNYLSKHKSTIFKQMMSIISKGESR